MVAISRDDFGGEEDGPVFSAEERAELVKAVSSQAGDMIDWLSISADVFENKFSPCQCIFEFLRLPIPQSLALNMHSTSDPANSANGSMDLGKAFKGEFPARSTVSVFNDSGNPLLT